MTDQLHVRHPAQEHLSRCRLQPTVLEARPPNRLVYTFHDGFAEGELVTFRKVGGGWPFILSNLKTLLETGQPLPASV